MCRTWIYYPSSRYLKLKVKNSVNYICAFEKTVAREARQRGFDGVVCGHIHRAEVREIDGTLYCNDGDWVESLCALVEETDGRLAILHWHDVARLLGSSDPGCVAPKLPAALVGNRD